MAKNNIKYILICVCWMIQAALWAVPADPSWRKWTQPDGSLLTIRLQGDEFMHYMVTEDGYFVMENEDGYYVYAQQNDMGKLVPSNVKARDLRTASDEAFLEAHPVDISFLQSAGRKARAAKGADDKQFKAYPTTGSIKSLVILVAFKDKGFVVANPQQAFSNMLNQVGYAENDATGSAKDYFSVASNRTFAPQFDVLGPYTLSQNMSYYGGNDKDDNDSNPRKMIMEACQLASKAGVNFSNYDADGDGVVDNVFVYYAGNNEAEGGGSRTVWPHSWTVAASKYSAPSYNGKKIWTYACTSELRSVGNTANDMCGIGTFVHEFSHVLGLPDYYCTTYECDSSTLGYWDVMDVGPYLNFGRTPPTYSAYNRFFLGWLVPQQLNESFVHAELYPVERSNKAYLLAGSTHNLQPENPNPSEFFILESRKKEGWDAFLPGEGMLIWHIKYNQPRWTRNEPNNYYPNGVELIRADGRRVGASSATPFPGIRNITFYSPELWNGYPLIPLANIRQDTVNGLVAFSKAFLSTAQDTLMFEYKTGLSKPLNILSSLPWQVISVPGWLKLSGNMGEGNMEMNVETIADNSGENIRKDYIVLRSDEINFTRQVLVIQNGQDALCEDVQAELILSDANRRLQVKSSLHSFRLEIWNNQGVRVFHNEHLLSNEAMDISTLPAGVYQVRIISYQGVISRSFTK